MFFLVLREFLGPPPPFLCPRSRPSLASPYPPRPRPAPCCKGGEGTAREKFP